MVYIVPEWSSFRALQLLGLVAQTFFPVLYWIVYGILWTRISPDFDLSESWDDFDSTASFTSHWHSLRRMLCNSCPEFADSYGMEDFAGVLAVITCLLRNPE